jgi:drug/metabolite transporter (DMT)-like permease
MIFIKILSRTESSVAIVAWMAIFLSLFSFIPAMLTWRDPSPETWAWLVFIGLIGTLAQVSLSQSLKETDPTAVLPFDFLKLIWTALLAAWFFAEIPDAFTLLGAVVIFGSGLYVAYRERQASRASGTAGG